MNINKYIYSLKSRIFTFLKFHRLSNPIYIGKNSDIKGNVKILGSVVLDDNVEIRNRTSKDLVIYMGCSFNRNSVVRGNVIIKENVAIGPNTVIIGANHNFENISVPINKQGSNSKGILIECNVWIGANVTVLDGVTIGEGSVIGAGSVVSKSIPAFSVAVGVPCRVIKTRT